MELCLHTLNDFWDTVTLWLVHVSVLCIQRYVTAVRTIAYGVHATATLI
jgi:hypothetical protein